MEWCGRERDGETRCEFRVDRQDKTSRVLREKNPTRGKRRKEKAHIQKDEDCSAGFESIVNRKTLLVSGAGGREKWTAFEEEREGVFFVYMIRMIGMYVVFNK